MGKLLAWTVLMQSCSRQTQSWQPKHSNHSSQPYGGERRSATLSNCNNWRGITLLSIPSKILAKIIIQRISDAIDKQLRKEQAGFRKGRGCVDHIFTLRNIIEQCTEWPRQLYINFVDFEKAFDSIHRDSLWRILQAYVFQNKLSFSSGVSIPTSHAKLEIASTVLQSRPG